jgi:hypothetical protein
MRPAGVGVGNKMGVIRTFSYHRSLITFLGVALDEAAQALARAGCILTVDPAIKVSASSGGKSSA